MTAVQLYPQRKTEPADHCFDDRCIRHESCCHCTCAGCTADRGPDRCRECEDEAVTGMDHDLTKQPGELRRIGAEAVTSARTARRRKEFARAIEHERYALALMARARKADREARA